MSYIKGHKSCGINVGDRVRVIRRAKNEEGGWDNDWVCGMDFCIGKTYTVILDSGCYGFLLNCKTVFDFPYFVLEKIEEEKVIENTYSSSCPQCKGELVDKYSDYVGDMIKKCKACGWC